MTGLPLRFGPARPADAVALARLVAASQPKAIRAMTIYGCRGVANYIALEIDHASPLAAGAYVVARNPSRLVGAAVWRRASGKLFLSHIAVAPNQRGRGIGTKLLASSLQLLKPQNEERIVLDVFADNLAALTWYRRLGFETDEHNGWWSPPWPSDDHRLPRGLERTVIAGLAPASAVFDRFGFSEFTLTVHDQSYQVGRLGHTWYRTTSAELIADRLALTALHRHDPSRRLLVILPLRRPPAPLKRLRPLISAMRMSISAAALKAVI